MLWRFALKPPKQKILVLYDYITENGYGYVTWVWG